MRLRESAIQKRIISRHKKAGWFVAKIIQSSTNGIPDLLLIRGGHVVFVEVKSEGGKLSPLQSYVHEIISAHNVKVYVTSDPNFLLL